MKVQRLCGAACRAIPIAIVLMSSSPVEAGATGGAVWSTHGPSDGGDVSSVAVAPSLPSRVYAALVAQPTANGGLFRSDDGGTTWTEADAGISQAFGTIVQPQVVAVDHANADLVYYGFLGSAASGYPGGLYGSSNGGATWSALSSLPVPPYVTAIVPSPTSTGIVYVATTDGLFVSDDAGATWLALSNGLPSNASINALSISAADASVIYALAYDGSSTSLYRSSDAGSTWTITGLRGITTTDPRVAAAPTDASVVYAAVGGAGVLRSSDGGGTWSPAGTGTAAVTAFKAIAVSPDLSQTAYAASSSGLLRTSDGGSDWTLVTGGLPSGANAFFWSVSFGADHTQVWSGVGDHDRFGLGAGGVWRSSDGGASWSPSTTGFPSDSSISAVAADPATTGSVWAAASNPAAFAPVFVSADGGLTWQRRGDGTMPPMTAIAVSAHAHHVYAAAEDGSVYVSGDDGATWSRAVTDPTMQIQAVTVDPTNDAVAYAGGSTATAVPSVATATIFRTSDGGASWHSVSSGLPPVVYVTSVAVDPSAPSTLYAGTRGGSGAGLYKSTDSGATWAPSDGGLGNVNVASIAIDPAAPSTLYIGLAGPGASVVTGVYKSTDGGATWAASYTGNGIVSVALDPADPSNLYASTGNGAGTLTVVASHDGGASWTTMAAGLDPSFPIGALAVDAEGTRVHGATQGEGVFDIVVGAPQPGVPEAPVAALLLIAGGAAWLVLRRLRAVVSPAATHP